jgi:hypothetical protein
MENKPEDVFSQAFAKMRKDIEEKFRDLMSQTKISADDLKKAFDAAVESATHNFVTATNQVIETVAGGKTLYKTTISLIESVRNEYMTDKPDEKDIYWTTHQNQVTEALKARHELLKEILNTVGTICGAFGGGTKSGND